MQAVSVDQRFRQLALQTLTTVQLDSSLQVRSLQEQVECTRDEFCQTITSKS